MDHDTEATASPRLRPALPADAPAIQVLMRDAVRDLFPAFYDGRQTASGAVHIAQLDTRLIDDGTYVVCVAGPAIVACGGWSRRAKLYAGAGADDDDERLLDPASEPARVRAMFVRADWTRRGLGRAIIDWCAEGARQEGFGGLVLMATLPGEQLYRACGFTERRRCALTLPDGVVLDGVEMERSV